MAGSVGSATAPLVRSILSVGLDWNLDRPKGYIWLVQSDIYSDGRYLALNPSYHAEDSAWKAARISEMLKFYQLQPVSVVEVGCGAGEVLVQLQRQFPSANRLEGWDVSPHAIALAAKRATTVVRFHHGDFLAEARDAFDLALCIDVFEHVEDYIGFIRRLRSTAKWKIFHIPLDISVQSVIRVRPITRERERVGHLHHFTKETALETLGVAGYEIAGWSMTAGALDLPDKSVLQRLARVPRRVCRALQPDLAARWLGGFSLLVLAR